MTANIVAAPADTGATKRVRGAEKVGEGEGDAEPTNGSKKAAAANKNVD